METMTNEMRARMNLLKENGYNVEAARKCWDFVRGGDEAKKQEPASDRLADGVYLIDTKGNAVLYDWRDTESINISDIAYVGIVQGCHSVAIALRDVSEGEITLTKKESKKGNADYIVVYEDALQDWDGKGNTERLKKIGLNPAIKLKDDEYIPALAEMYLICLNQKYINTAMRFVGGQEMKGWYWSSTEYDTHTGWSLYINGGGAYYGPKMVAMQKVRIVKQFLL